MDPSHARKYSEREIEVKALEILKKAYPTGISIPINIDRIVYQHEMIDDIVPIELLEDRFNVAAGLYCKPDGKIDIIIDQETFDYQGVRANFSIAHEFGHIVLHAQIWSNCQTIEDSLALHRRINNKYHYRFIERAANRFASAILMPISILPKDTARLYTGLVKLYGYEDDLILHKIYSNLAKMYEVSLEPMQIRQKELDLQKKIRTALRYKLPYLEP